MNSKTALTKANILISLEKQADEIIDIKYELATSAEISGNFSALSARLQKSGAMVANLSSALDILADEAKHVEAALDAGC